MSRVTRIATAIVLGLAVAALPVVLDRCAESCEAHREAVASTPSCHHTASTATRIGQVPTPCGHDHNGTTVTAARNTAPTGRAFDVIVAVDSVRAALPPDSSDRRVPEHSPPGSSLSISVRSLPLLI
jgi:hypothetical protein